MERIQDARILLADDETDLLALLREALFSAGYRHLTMAASAAAARAAFARERPDFIVLDINLPDGDGFSLFQAFREAADIPVLFLSARDADSDRLFGLGLGADDYLTKPFLTQELLLRIATILRRTYRAQLGAGKEPEIALGAVHVDLSQAVAVTPRGTLQLTATERALLQKLAENRGRIVSYDALCEAVWGAGYYGYENSLNVHLRHLREKLEENPSRPRYLVTVRGLGYKLLEEDAP